MQLEKILLTVVLHKRIDGIDTILASLAGPLNHSPAAKEFGLRRFGTYWRAPRNTNYAFVRLDKMWDKEVEDTTLDSELSSESDEELDTRDDNNDCDGADNPEPKKEQMDIDEDVFTDEQKLPAERTGSRKKNKVNRNK
jgi:hypothetical protein